MSGVVCSSREGSFKNKENSTQKKMLPFVMQYHPALPNLENILTGKWHLIQNHIAKKSHQNISWSKLIYENGSLKSCHVIRLQCNHLTALVHCCGSRLRCLSDSCCLRESFVSVHKNAEKERG